MKTYLNEIFYLLGDDKKKIPWLILLFLGVSLLDLAGLWFIGPYVALVVDPEAVISGKISQVIAQLGLPNDQQSLVIIIGVILLCIFFFKALVTIGINYQIIRFSQQRQYKLRSILMSAYLSLPYVNYLNRNSSEYIHSIQALTGQFSKSVVSNGLRSLSDGIVAIMITSDKAYDNVEWVWGYRETDRLGGKDPYSASKGMAELVIRTYVESFFNSKDSNVRVGITRAGNVIGGGDWATDRIVPDCMQAWSLNKTVDIRSPNATRPWQHVLEPLSGYLTLAISLSQNSKYHGEAYNFGPSSNQNYPVSELIDEMAKYWDSVRWNDISESQGLVHEASLLKLNCDKALFDLQWQPTMQFSDTVKMTVEWYKHYYQNTNQSMYDLTISQIDEYTKLSKAKYNGWSY